MNETGEKSLGMRAKETDQALRDLITEKPADQRTPEEEAYVRELTQERDKLLGDNEAARAEAQREMVAKLAIDHEGILNPVDPSTPVEPLPPSAGAGRVQD